MAKISNTFTASSATASERPVGNREELSDVVSRIAPEDTPVYTMMGKGTCSSIFPEWELDDLARPNDNALPEGDEYSYTAIDPVTRVGNVCQIFRKAIMISNTQDKVMNAAGAEQTKYQILKKGVELKKDLEFIILSNNTSVKDAAIRQLGGLQTWLTTNTLRAPAQDMNADSDTDDAGEEAGADGGFNSSTGLTQAVDPGPSNRALTKDLIDEMMVSLYNNGGNCKYMVMSPYAKSVFSGFMENADIAALRTQVNSGQATLIGAADMYQSDFGLISVVPNRVMRGIATDATATEISEQNARNTENAYRAKTRQIASNVFFLDPSMLEFKWLRPIQRVADVAKRSDATPAVVLGEGTLCVKNEAGLGVIGDVFGTTATV